MSNNRCNKSKAQFIKNNQKNPYRLKSEAVLSRLHSLEEDPIKKECLMNKILTICEFN